MFIKLSLRVDIPKLELGNEISGLAINHSIDDFAILQDLIII